MAATRKQLWSRAALVFQLMGPILFRLAVRSVKIRFARHSVHDHDLETAHRVRAAMESLGVIFIKLGQLLGVRADFLPPEYVTELSRLQDRVTPTPFPLVKAFLEREYQQPLTAILDSIVEKPLATASIGQVHRARFQGQEVVIKFLRPETLELLEKDLRLLRMFARFGTRWSSPNQWKLIEDILNTIESSFGEESDFTVERVHAERIRRQLEGFSAVYVPQVIPELCTRNVIGLEYCTGARISDTEQIQRWGIDGNRLLNRLVEMYARMILLDGYYHADPHPGNFLVKPDGTVILLDFGLVQQLSEQTRTILYNAAQAALSADLDTIVTSLYDSGILNPEVGFFEAREFVRAFARISFESSDTRGRVQAIEELLKNTPQIKLSIPPDLLYAFRLIQMLEGVASHFQPGWNVIADGGPGLSAAFEVFLVEQSGIEELSPGTRLFTMLRFGLNIAVDNLRERFRVLRRILIA